MNEEKKTNIEDIFLYIFGILFTGILIIFFYSIKNESVRLDLSPYEVEMNRNLMLDTASSGYAIHRDFLKAQMQIVYKRYELGRRIQKSNIYLKYVGFLVGTILSLLGAMVVIRGVRDNTSTTIDTSITEKARVKFITSSPGVFIVFAGCAIILTTILGGAGQTTITDQPISLPKEQNRTVIEKIPVSLDTINQ